MDEKRNVNYAWPVTSVNSILYRRISEWVKKRGSILCSKRIIIFGAGIRGTEFNILLGMMGINVSFFSDNNSEKWGGNIDDIQIISTKQMIDEVNKGGHIILISTENSKPMEIQLKEAGFKENVDFYSIRTGEYEEYVKEFARKYNGTFLFMGDCVFSNISIHDFDMRNLAEILKDEFGLDATKVLAMHGMGLRSQYYVFKEQLRTNIIPNTLFIMINLDTLTGKQHLLPRAQHTELLKMIYNLSDVKDREFEEYISITANRMNNVQAEFFIEEMTTSNEILKKIKNRNYFRLNYMYKLNVDTEGLIFLKRMIVLGKENGVRLIAFIPPVNYVLGEELLGSEFRDKYNANIIKILTILESEKVDFLDFSFDLPADRFSEPYTPDETVNEKGRKEMVECFRRAIRK